MSYKNKFLLLLSISFGFISTMQAMRSEMSGHAVSGSDDLTALHMAIQSDNLELAEKLLKKDANPNKIDSRGTHPLHLVNSIAMAKLLLSYGANSNYRNHLNQSALYHLISHNNDKFAYDITKFLLKIEKNVLSLMDTPFNVLTLNVLTLREVSLVNEDNYLQSNLIRDAEDFEHMNNYPKKYNNALLIFDEELSKDSREIMFYKTFTDQKYSKTLATTYKMAREDKNKQKELCLLLKSCEDDEQKEGLLYGYILQEELNKKINNKCTDIEIHCQH